MNDTEFDVIVAGAGPAGCAAAIALKLAGIKVCLADKELTTDYKVGESIPGATIRLLNRLGINGIDDLLHKNQYNPCHSNASAWGSEEWVYQSGLKNPEGGGYHINRILFDEAIKTKATSLDVPMFTALIDQISILSDEEASQKFLIQFKNDTYKNITAKWIIDATGRKVAIGRKLGIKKNRIDNQMAAINWVKAPPDDTDSATRIKSTANGWWYTALLPNQKRVIGFQSLPDTISQMHKNPHLFFQEFNESQILPYKITSESSVKNIAVEAGLSISESITENRLLCVGDAALSFDPLASQGIFFALYSGIKGAETIINCLNDGSLENKNLADYKLIINQVFNENKKALRYFYLNEIRFQNHPYWKSRRTNFEVLS
ncbi:NAD(P)/FAD-dependent oxidoreductase [Flavobacterium branchiicola]|uniref:NAD(P)/FAD-dependent oxidoreductase n=1 Tax=Flavobacterium branchiicola TaxID=1114875 RepID=A0ABV9PBT2_9FLAO|nr:tryptophan 7-halogenase [Flavobacterium branchiicola]MBS7253590.1 tryptophan 7-halogenase [Flavobacterium branchiicola]